VRVFPIFETLVLVACFAMLIRLGRAQKDFFNSQKSLNDLTNARLARLERHAQELDPGSLYGAFNAGETNKGGNAT
jgi:hypothetical protein